MKRIPAFIILMVISLVSAVLLALTNEVTREPIARAASAVADASRFAVLPSAERFEPASAPDGLDSLYTGFAGDAAVGTAAAVTVQGFAGPIEVTVGMDAANVITGVTVGGSAFAETAGLGARATESAFTDQFVGKTPPLLLGETIDALSGATITSRAVVEGVNLAAGGMSAPAPANMAEPSQQRGVVSASAMGFAGPVQVKLSVDADGLIDGLTIGGSRFAETEGLGGKVRDETFTAQFIGKKPPLTLADIDAISGATISTQAALDAVNAAYAFYLEGGSGDSEDVVPLH